MAVFWPHFVVASDAPGPDQSNSPNHGGGGQNVLHEDGSVLFVVDHLEGGTNDDFFRNANNEVGPRTGPDDSSIPPTHIRIRVTIHFR